MGSDFNIFQQADCKGDRSPIIAKVMYLLARYVFMYVFRKVGM